MPRFSALNELGYKVYKFQQNKSIATFANEPDIHREIQAGICGPLTARWLAEKISNPGTLQFGGDSSSPTLHIRQNRDIVRENITRQVRYRNIGVDWLITDVGLAERRIAAFPSFHAKAPARALAGITNHLTPSSGAFIVMRFGNSTDNHAMGLCRGTDNGYYFFDANCGVYRLPRPPWSTQGFFDKLVECYRSNAGIELRYGRTVFVVKAAPLQTRTAAPSKTGVLIGTSGS